VALDGCEDLQNVPEGVPLRRSRWPTRRTIRRARRPPARCARCTQSNRWPPRHSSTPAGCVLPSL